MGLEIDQVRKTPEGDVPVPINVAYNHHHDTAVVGKAARLVKVDRDDPRFEQAGRKYVRLSGMKAWVAEEVEPSAQGLPTSAMFSDGNGGEYRKSLHAYAPPYAQIIESPTQLAGAPMQIDTWNRDEMDVRGGPFVPGPYPKTAYAPRSGPDAIYSGLLECPLTDRVEKVLDSNDTSIPFGKGSGYLRSAPPSHPRLPRAHTSLTSSPPSHRASLAPAPPSRPRLPRTAPPSHPRLPRTHTSLTSSPPSHRASLAPAPPSRPRRRYRETGETVRFAADRCLPFPREQILEERNPTCDLRTYTGGLVSCHHGWHLLDAEQAVPWPDQPLVYYKKFRVYFQPYNASLHRQVERQDWGIAADGDRSEYDVEQCAAGTPEHDCRKTITGTWMPVPAGGEPKVLLAVHDHCHAPTCLKMEMWNNDTGKLLCRQEILCTPLPAPVDPRTCDS